MNPNKLFPLVITNDLKKTRAFYVDMLGYAATLDTDGYLQIRFGDDTEAPELAFMAPNAAPALGKLPAFDGVGLVISIPTPDADRHHASSESKSLPVLAPPSDKPWGWRSYTVRDPNGVILDFFHVLADAASGDAAG